jgi:hypothetical protein
MKSFLLASTLLISGAAFAQTTSPTDAGQPTTTTTTTDQGMTQGDPAAQGTPTTSQDPAATTGTTSGAGTMSTDQTGSSGTMTDQSGAAQGSMGAQGTTDSQQGAMGAQGSMGAQQGATGTTGAGTVTYTQGGNMTPPPEPRASYPRCSRTITDNCVQNESRARDTKRSRR